MGSAVVEAQRRVGTDTSSEEGVIKVRAETTDGVRACHSFWEVLRGAAGATGARLSEGIAQQDCPQQWQCFEPQQLCAAGAPTVAISVETAKTLCQTVTKLTTTARSTVAPLPSRSEIEIVMSCSFTIPPSVCPSGGSVCPKFQFLSSPQVSIAFPM
jgi:hypothetical protein